MTFFPPEVLLSDGFDELICFSRVFLVCFSCFDYTVDLGEVTAQTSQAQ